MQKITQMHKKYFFVVVFFYFYDFSKNNQEN